METPRTTVLLALVQLFSLCIGIEYYVCTSDTEPNCHTLNYYASKTSELFDNTTDQVSLLFKNGVHNLNTPFHVEYAAELSLAAVDSGLVTINISNSACALEFTSIGVLRLQGIGFVSEYAQEIDDQVCFDNLSAFEAQGLNFTNSPVHLTYNNSPNTSPHMPQVSIHQSQFYSSALYIEYTAGLITTTLSDVRCTKSEVRFTLIGSTTLSLINSNFVGSKYGLYIVHRLCGWEDLSVRLKNLLVENNTKGGIVYQVLPNQSDCSSHGLKAASNNSSNLTVTVTNTALLNNGEDNGLIFFFYYNASVLNIAFDSCIAKGNKGDGVRITPLFELVLRVFNSSFLDNRHSGLVVEHDETYVDSNVHAFITGCKISNNKFGLSLLLNFTMLNAEMSDVTLERNRQSGLFIRVGGALNMAFQNCTVTANNYIGAFTQSGNSSTISVSNSMFEENYRLLGVFYSNGDRQSFVTTASTLMITCPPFQDSQVAITDCVFNNNTDYNIKSRITHVIECRVVQMNGSNLFTNNLGTPIEFDHSNVYVTDSLTFRNNSAFEGGGMSLVYLSTLYVNDDTTISFTNNSVVNTGGGIFYTSTIGSQASVQCFYQLPGGHGNISISFSSNTAVNGGEDIYGAAVNDLCYVNQNTHSRDVYEDLFHLSNTSFSSVSSEGSRVCLCDKSGVPNCTDPKFILSNFPHPIFPGETIVTSAVIVGKDFGTVTGSVYSNLIGGNASSIEDSQLSKRVGFRQCNPLKYTLYSETNTSTTLVLTATPVDIHSKVSEDYVKAITTKYERDQVSSELILTMPVYVNITFKQCPLGFSLSDKPPYKCRCAEQLSSGGIRICVIQNHTGVVHRSQDLWVGAVSSEVLVSNCPFGYCTKDNISVDPLFPDNQCTHNRSGVLCGQCSGNLTLALGSYRCIECLDNRYITLIIPIVIGILFLVVFIKVLGLTVSKGTINGLIFYANVVWANEGIFFSGIDTESFLYQITHTFLAWVNLDIGIETCFIAQLDAIGKNWFHYGQSFVYVICVSTLIYLASRYSILATKILGNNAVQVLSTIFFLSYTKLFQTIINTLSFSLLHFSNRTEIVWALDGNVPYFGLSHSFLFVVAILAFVLLWLPYTVFLTFGQCLRKKSHLRLLKWMDRQKPYFDAYYGPFKDRYHYWFGALLVARGVLLCVYAFTPASASMIDLMAIVVVAGCLLCHSYQYKVWVHSLLEKLFLLNLILISSGVLLVEQQNVGDKSVIVYLSVGFSLVAFVLIGLFHTWSALQKFSVFRKCSKSREAYESIDHLTQASEAKTKRPRRASIDELRESILQDTVQ